MKKPTLKCKLLLIYALFITTVPQEPSAYSFTADSLCCMLCLTSSYLLYSYYGSAPTTRKTSINTTLQLIATIFAISLIRSWAFSLFVNLLTEQTKLIFQAYPNVMCSLTSDRFIFYLFVSAFSSLFVLRCGMKLWPLQFVDLKHDAIGTSIIVITGLYVITEFIASLVRYQTFCPISYLSILNVIYNFDLDEPNSKRHSTPLLYIFIAIAFYAEIIPKVVNKWKIMKRKHRNNVVAPVYTINLPLTIPISINVEQPSTSRNLDTNIISNRLLPIKEQSTQNEEIPPPTTAYDAIQGLSPVPEVIRSPYNSNHVLTNNYLLSAADTDSGNTTPTNFTFMALSVSFIIFYIYNFFNITTKRIDNMYVIVLNTFQRLCTYMLPVYWISHKDNLQLFVVHKMNVWMNTYLPIQVTDKVKKYLFPSSVNPAEMY